MTAVGGLASAAARHGDEDRCNNGNASGPSNPQPEDSTISVPEHSHVNDYDSTTVAETKADSGLLALLLSRYDVPSVNFVLSPQSDEEQSPPKVKVWEVTNLPKSLQPVLSQLQAQFTQWMSGSDSQKRLEVVDRSSESKNCINAVVHAGGTSLWTNRHAGVYACKVCVNARRVCSRRHQSQYCALPLPTGARQYYKGFNRCAHSLTEDVTPECPGYWIAEDAKIALESKGTADLWCTNKTLKNADSCDGLAVL